MSAEKDAIAATTRPGTVCSLVSDLGGLGLGRGDIVIVHSSLSALGWIVGGAQAVVEALLQAVGPEGTIVMPTQTGQLTDPANWTNPPVPSEWIPIIRDEIPAFDPAATLPRGMGKVVESFLMHGETMRSNHPTVSFAARGPAASEIVGCHPLSPELGETSPLGRLYELDAKVLLLGVEHGNNTSLHLAEHRAVWPSKTVRETGAPVMIEGNRQWVIYQDLDWDDGDFENLGMAFANSGMEARAPVGTGFGKLCRQRSLVDFATKWLSDNRR